MGKHTGLFFGTFNPIHMGHLILAQYMLEFTALDEVWFMVTPQSPFKKNQKLADDRERLHMVREALESDPYHMRASDDEFYLPKPSYTITTLIHLSEKYPDRQFSLIVGQDNLKGFKKWRNWERILERHQLFVYPRKGASGSDLEIHPHVHLTEAPEMEISSTFIRKAVNEGRNVSYMVPPKVWEYIQHNGLYR